MASISLPVEVQVLIRRICSWEDFQEVIEKDAVRRPGTPPLTGITTGQPGGM
jgi:hypothetical protein